MTRVARVSRQPRQGFARVDVGQAGEERVVMAEHDLARFQELDLIHEKPRERPLVWFAVDVGSTHDRENGDVRSELGNDPRPVPPSSR